MRYNEIEVTIATQSWVISIWAVTSTYLASVLVSGHCASYPHPCNGGTGGCAHRHATGGTMAPSLPKVGLLGTPHSPPSGFPRIWIPSSRHPDQENLKVEPLQYAIKWYIATVNRPTHIDDSTA